MSTAPSAGPPDARNPEGLAGWVDQELHPHGKPAVRCVIVTPEKAVFDGAGDFLVLPMFDGELGVMPNRAPLIGRLGAGELRLKAGATTTRFFVQAGFVQVRDNVVTVLTDRAMKAADVTAAVVEKAAADAEAMPATNAIERAAKAKARDRAQGLRKVADHNSGVVAH